MNNYGKELVIDLHDCDISKFNRKDLRKFFKELCFLIDMNRAKLVFWDDLNTPEEEKETEAHLVGTSAIQFITTSNITIHTLDILKRVYINIFTCKDFNADTASAFIKNWFKGKIISQTIIERI